MSTGLPFSAWAGSNATLAVLELFCITGLFVRFQKALKYSNRVVHDAMLSKANKSRVFAWVVPGSNLFNAVEKTIIIVKFKLKVIILSKVKRIKFVCYSSKYGYHTIMSILLGGDI